MIFCCSLLIVGAGAAGISAAVAAWDAGTRDILLVDRESAPGGILPRCIHRGFGLASFGEELTGPEYVLRLEEQLTQTGVSFLSNTEILSVSKDRKALLSREDGLYEVSFQRLILATGCREIGIGSLPVSGTRPAGIFTAGQAQELINLRHMNLGSRVVILGSGDLGMIMARRFTLEGKQVIALIEKEDRIGGMARNYRRCIEAFHIPVIFSAELVRISGEDRITSVTVCHTGSNTLETIPCDTLVTAIGLCPDRSLTRNLGSPDWLKLCGNCSRVHDIVDSAAEEARKVGTDFGGKI